MSNRLQIAATRNFTRFTDVEQSIPDRFEHQVSKHSGRIAVKGRKRTFTYDALNRYANQITRAILALRGTGEEVIGLILEKDAPMMAAFLGVLKAGKIYVAIDPTEPEARVSKIFEDAQVNLIVTDDKNFKSACQLGHGRYQVLNIDRIESTLPDGNPGLSIAPETLAYITYTSGSTGQPKGVVQDHRTVLHRTKRQTNEFGISENERITLLSSCSTGFAMADIYTALLNGAAIYPFEVKEEGFARLAAWLREEEISLFHTSASLFRYFLGSVGDSEVFSSVRLVWLGGEQLYKKDAELFKRHFSPTCVLANSLASAEAGVVRVFFVGQETSIDGAAIPAGFSVEDMEILLLDEAGDPVGFNSTGEITIRSRYLTLGYWRRPELTRKVLLPDPEGGDARIFHTGDLGRMTPDGCLEYLGRKDFLVKIRGFRVELAEVEAAFLELGQVNQVAVVAKENSAGERHLVAYVVAAQKEKASTAEGLRLLLQHKLPEYMLPAKFVFLDALPLASNGKVDLRALPSPEQAHPEMQKPVSPRDAIEEQLTNIWETALGIRCIGVQDDFFDLGGHSLAAMQMFSDIDKSFGRNLPVTTIFEAPTIEKLANILRQKEYEASTVVLLQGASAGVPIFCVPGPKNSVFGYFELARALGSERPVYGLRALRESGRHAAERALSTSKEIALYYIQQMRSVQPEGPYLLIGHSAGGIIAFEIAQQLESMGQAVGLLALLDTWYPGYLSTAQNASLLLQRFLQLGFKEKLAYVRGVCRDIKTRAVQRYAKNRIAPIAWQYRDYAPQPHPVRVTLFRARNSNWLRPYLGRDLGWSNVAKGGMDVYEVPGDHITMVKKPHVSSLAAQLKACLERTLAPSYELTTRIAIPSGNTVLCKAARTESA